jgi:hypothetical protein
MGAEAYFFAFAGLTGIALLSLLRRERKHPRSTPPFLLGVYRGLVFLVVLFVGYTVFVAVSRSFR